MIQKIAAVPDAVDIKSEESFKISVPITSGWLRPKNILPPSTFGVPNQLKEKGSVRAPNSKYEIKKTFVKKNIPK